MKALNKLSLMILALMLALTLSVAAFAEGTDASVTESATVATETDPAATDTAPADAQAEANALNDALAAYRNAKAAARKQAILDSLKQELDSYVDAGSLTREQADLILKYYTEQITLNSSGFGRGGKRMRNGQDSQSVHQGGFGCSCKGLPDNRNGQKPQGTRPNGFGMGGHHGRFNNALPAPDANSGATPVQPAAPDGNMPAAPDGTPGT